MVIDEDVEMWFQQIRQMEEPDNIEDPLGGDFGCKR